MRHPHLTEQYADKLSKAWKAVYDAYNLMEDLRPGGGFDSFVRDTESIATYEVLVKPHYSFPIEVGGTFTVTGGIFEWAHEGKMHVIEPSKFTNSFLPIPHKNPILDHGSNEVFKQIVANYNQYGYLEDREAKWLLSNFKTTTP